MCSEEGKLDPGENSEFLVDFKRKIQTDQEDLKEGEEGVEDVKSDKINKEEEG